MTEPKTLSKVDFKVADELEMLKARVLGVDLGKKPDASQVFGSEATTSELSKRN
jgi:hypothetical protein